KYIDQHRGEIAIASKVGEGTSIRILLPEIKKELEVGEVEQIQSETSHSEKDILLVEDEPAIAEIQSKILSSDPCRHRVDIAINGKMAMEMAEAKHYDVISLDYMLPGDINGMDVYRHIRQTDTETPVIFISGNVEFLASIKALRQKDPFIDHLSKPCMNLDYVRGINRLLDKVTE
ncbi:MAG: response regulator, partial [Desulfobacterales bacterium]|nr:response regulator [Desulfobacterales bacterium]